MRGQLLSGRQCIFCGSSKALRTACGYVKCRACSKWNRLSRLGREIAIERESRVYTKVLESVSAEALMHHIKAHTRKGSDYCTDAFRGVRSWLRCSKQHTVSYRKSLVDNRTKTTPTASRASEVMLKHIRYNYRGVSQYRFPMYLKEIEYRFNRRKENVFKQFLNIDFGCVSPSTPLILFIFGLQSWRENVYHMCFRSCVSSETSFTLRAF